MVVIGWFDLGSERARFIVVEMEGRKSGSTEQIDTNRTICSDNPNETH